MLNIGKAFDNEINLPIDKLENKIYVLYGINGSGKTTVLKLLKQHLINNK